jgi:hypothetical protein
MPDMRAELVGVTRKGINGSRLCIRQYVVAAGFAEAATDGLIGVWIAALTCRVLADGTAIRHVLSSTEDSSQAYERQPWWNFLHASLRYRSPGNSNGQDPMRPIGNTP